MKRTLFAAASALLIAGIVYGVLRAREPEPAEPEPASAPVATVPAANTGALKPALPQAEFQKKLDAAQENFPTSDKIAALPDEQVHDTPRPLVDAGFQIGEIAEAITKNPALGAQGMEFYGKCARRAELAVSVRAHCLHNLRELGKRRDETVKEDGIAEGVLKLEGPATR